MSNNSPKLLAAVGKEWERGVIAEFLYEKHKEKRYCKFCREHTTHEVEDFLDGWRMATCKECGYKRKHRLHVIENPEPGIQISVYCEDVVLKLPKRETKRAKETLQEELTAAEGLGEGG